MKKTLLAVSGLSPQVITETLYALLQQGRLPDAVRVLTTGEGKARCIAELFGAGDGHYHKFLCDYDLPENAIDFSPRHVVAVESVDGQTLNDIVGEEENELFLTACMQHAYELTSDPNRAVYFSIAGGRKTMGACLSSTAHFYGRPQDRVFHVLISPEFESNRDFYYPPKVSREITLYGRDGQPYRKETRYARITLIPMAFVSVRDRLTEGIISKPEKPSTLLMSLVRENKSELVLDVAEGTITWRGIEADLSPTLMAAYAFIALIKKEGSCEKSLCHGCDECFLTLDEISGNHERIAQIYRKIIKGKYIENKRDAFRGILKLDGDNFKVYRTRLNQELGRFYGAGELENIKISDTKSRPNRYGITMGQSQIRIII